MNLKLLSNTFDMAALPPGKHQTDKFMELTL